MEKQIEDLIYEIRFGNLDYYLDQFDTRLIGKALCIYVNKVNNCFNIPCNFLDIIIEEIKKINIEEEE